jgi:ABC-type transport system involved in multi-copper enzyme maturation permease subunit
MPILSIARFTLKEYIQEKVLFVALAFVILLIGSSFVLSPLAVGAQKKIIVDLGLASVSLFGMVLVVLLGAGSYYREKEKGILTTMLSKPISRVDYIIGKYCGMVATVLLVMVLMAAAFLAALVFSRTTITGNILWAVYLSMIETVLIAAVMVFFTMFTSPVLSSFFTVCIFVCGHLSKDILTFGQQFAGGALKAAALASFYLLPNLSLFNTRQEAVHNLPIPGGFLYSVTVYGVLYTLLMLLFSSLLFRKGLSP